VAPSSAKLHTWICAVTVSSVLSIFSCNVRVFTPHSFASSCERVRWGVPYLARVDLLTGEGVVVGPHFGAAVVLSRWSMAASLPGRDKVRCPGGGLSNIQLKCASAPRRGAFRGALAPTSNNRGRRHHHLAHHGRFHHHTDNPRQSFGTTLREYPYANCSADRRSQAPRHRHNGRRRD
jgi:hypothetical protein